MAKLTKKRKTLFYLKSFHHKRLGTVASCEYCFASLTFEKTTLEHVKPRCMGGKHGFSNLVLACQGCNSRKSRLDNAEAMLAKATESIAKLRAARDNAHKEWHGFLRNRKRENAPKTLVHQQVAELMRQARKESSLQAESMDEEEFRRQSIPGVLDLL